MSALLAAVMACCLAWVCLRGSRHAQYRPKRIELHVSLPFILEMVTVCVRMSASIPRALEMVGTALEGEFGEGLCAVSQELQAGTAWHEAWMLTGHAPCMDGTADQQSGRDGRYAFYAFRDSGAMGYRGFTAHYARLAEALEPSWRHGVSPVLRIEAVIEQLDRDYRRDIEEAGSRLAVRVLLPVGLCFLPSFIMVGVIPCLAAFASDMF
ncbi:tadC protein [Bifidobacterium sp.]|uniref:tadC protein n=1 Tax=Bifidobacterium sp. TaxID=41200 RepID=UPI0039E8F960